MPDAGTHPSSKALALFGGGKLSDAQAATVAAHLESCPACRDTVARLAPDSLLRKLRDLDQSATAFPSTTPPSLPTASVSSTPGLVLPPELTNHPKFRIVRELGRGGMGVVYLAVHRVMDKPVALKVVNPSLLDNADSVARFLAEARAAGKLDHPNIARAHDADQAGNLHFLVLEYVEGRTLAQLVEQKGAQPISHACHFIRQAALGLQHAADQGMAHRDVKPQNLMITPRGQVKVLDFGLARLRGEYRPGPRLTQTHSFMGTPEYVSPEQATDARQADVRSDIYSLGCTLFTALTGRPPFVADTAIKLVLAHIEQAAPSPRALRPGLPAGLEPVVARMLAKEPEKRYQKPSEVAQALAPFVKTGGSGGTEVVLAERKKRRLDSDAKQPNVELVLAEPDVELVRARSGRRGALRKGALLWSFTCRMGRKQPIVLVTLLLGLILLAAVAFHSNEKPESAGTNDKPKEESWLPVVDLGDGLKLELVRIEAGEFLMGAPEDEEGADADEKPRHRVRISKPFYLGKYPITQEQYERVMDKNPSSFSASGGNSNLVAGMSTRQFPVEKVSWQDATLCCDKLTLLTKLQIPEVLRRQSYRFRLPTEAQWEYACRAGTTTPFFFGKELNGDKANCNGESPYGTQEPGRFVKHPTKVGSYDPNPWGLYDMHGNVFQWCEDCFQGKDYPNNLVVDPVKTSDAGDKRCVARGGSYSSPARSCRAAYRWPQFATAHQPELGFRVAFRPD